MFIDILVFVKALFTHPFISPTILILQPILREAFLLDLVPGHGYVAPAMSYSI